MLKHLSANEKKALKEFKDVLVKKFGKELLQLKLYGSKARGDFKRTKDIGEMSDTDIFIVLKKRSIRRESFICKIASDMLLKYSVNVSPTIFSEKEYQENLNLQVPFVLIIEQEGVSLL